MIQLEHLNIVVKNMDDTLAFYQAAFPHWQIRGQGEGEWYGVNRQWLHFGDEYQYLTFNDNGQGTIRDLASNQLGLAHFAFVTANLDRLATRLSEHGFEPSKQGAQAPHRRNLYYVDPNGFEVEFVEYLSDVPSERNLYD